MIPQSATKIQLVATVALLILCVGWTAKGIKENLAHNDFDVIRMGAQLAMEKNADIYDTKLRIKDRHFVYPPGASVLLMPIALPPLEVGAVVSAILKGLAILALALISTRWSGDRNEQWLAMMPVALATLLILFRPIDNDFGNGQVNIHLAFMAVAGMLLMFSPSKSLNLAGAVLFSVAIVIKPPPALMAGALLLHRRWLSLALVVGLSMCLWFGLPRVWFGAELAGHLHSEYASRTDRMMFDAKEGDQVSIHEALIFGFTQLNAPAGVELDDEKLYIRENGEKRRIKLEDPFSERTAKLMWVAVGGLVGIGFLLGRWRLSQSTTLDAAWDIAVLAGFCILLSPLARKAHLVILVYPLCLVLSRFADDALRQGWKSWMASNRVNAGLLAACTIGFWASDDLPLPVPGFPMPLRPALLVSVILLQILLFRLARASSIPPSDPQSSF